MELILKQDLYISRAEVLVDMYIWLVPSRLKMPTRTRLLRSVQLFQVFALITVVVTTVTLNCS